MFYKCGATILGLKVKCFSAGASKVEEENGLIVTHLLTHLGRAIATAGAEEKDGVLSLIEGGSFTLHCGTATLSTIVVKGEVISLLETLEGEEIVAGREYGSLYQKFTKDGDGIQSEKTFFLLLLAKPTTESGEMIGVHLTLQLNGGFAEEASQASITGNLENFKNSAGTEIDANFERG